MQKRLNGFDRIAPYYDLLSDIVFGGAIFRSQTFFLSEIKPGSRVLILGGGSGRILQPLFRINPDVHVWYVEASSAMIARTRKQLNPAWDVRLIHGTETDIPDPGYDAVILPFFLDMFDDEDLSRLIEKLLNLSYTGAQWHVTDFIEQKIWHRVMLKIMYGFFNIVSEVRATSLPSWEKTLKAHGLIAREANSFFGGFIRACTYHVTTHT